MIRAIDRMLCNWHSDILTCRPKLVKQIGVKEKVTRNGGLILCNDRRHWSLVVQLATLTDIESWTPLIHQPPLSIVKLSSTYTNCNCLYATEETSGFFKLVTRISLEYWGEAVPKFIVWNMRPKLIIPNSESLFQTNFGTKVEISHPEAYSQSHTHPEAYTHPPRGTSHVAWEH